MFISRLFDREIKDYLTDYQIVDSYGRGISSFRMVLPWIWVVLWICNVGDLALTCADLALAFQERGDRFSFQLVPTVSKNV